MDHLKPEDKFKIKQILKGETIKKFSLNNSLLENFCKNIYLFIVLNAVLVFIYLTVYHSMQYKSFAN